jgi:hypothetical protein
MLFIMLKVICTKDCSVYAKTHFPLDEFPEVGEVYTAINEIKYQSGADCWILEEIQPINKVNPNIPIGYPKKCFDIVSDEMLADLNEMILNQELV